MGIVDETQAGAVDPASIPERRLYTGAAMPAVGLGTFGSDHVTPSQVAEAVERAAAVGYRHFDCASVYGNEDAVGASLASYRAKRDRREALWVTSKLWNDKHAPATWTRRAESRSPICVSTISTSTSCTGRSRTTIRRVVT